MKPWLVAAAALLISACGAAQREPEQPLTARIGWITGGCLAIANDAVADGTAVIVATLGDTEALVDARVTKRGSPERRCPAQKAAAEIASDLSFYELSSPVDIGIGVVGPVARVSGGIDVNGDGRAELFTRCAGSEGINYRVWSAGPYVGEPLWSGYEYLGYDIEADCPK
jgi:hypothetical protein